MTDDARYLIETFRKQYDMFIELMKDKRLRRDKFDRYSYSSYAIKLLLQDVDECTSYKDVSLIRQLIMLHAEMYASFISGREKYNKEPKMCFKCGYKAMKYFYNITEGYRE